MTPEQCNREFGKPVWRCNQCRTETGLSWWHGLSVAICGKDACHKDQASAFRAAVDAEDDYQDYLKENMPW